MRAARDPAASCGSRSCSSAGVRYAGSHPGVSPHVLIAVAVLLPIALMLAREPASERVLVRLPDRKVVQIASAPCPFRARHARVGSMAGHARVTNAADPRRAYRNAGIMRTGTMQSNPYPDLERFDATYDGVTRTVFRGGRGPAVIVMHEVPGLYPAVVAFGRRLIAAGLTTYFPSLIGQPGRPMGVAYSMRSLARACVSQEFATWATGKTSPIVTWLRALAKDAHVCTKPPDPQPQAFFELELGFARVHEAELAMRMLAAKLPVSLHGRATVGADLDDPNSIEDAEVVRAVRLERLNDEPLVGMCCADLAPPHATTLTGSCDTGQFFAVAGEAAGRFRGSSSSVGQQRAFCCPSDVATRDNHDEFGGGGGSRTLAGRM